MVGLLFGELADAFPDAGGVYPAFMRVLGERMDSPYMVLMLGVEVANIALPCWGWPCWARRIALPCCARPRRSPPFSARPVARLWPCS
jgi:hypothetical protein